MRKQVAALTARSVSLVARFGRVLAVVALALTGAIAVYAGPADLARGLSWLQAQVNQDGRLLAKGGVASSAQATCETATTLQRLAGNSSQVTALIAALQPTGHDVATESLACWQYLRQQLGQSILDTDLERRRTAGEGYAAYDEMTVSSAVDTGWALSARLQHLSTTDKASALAWLQGAQASTGAFALGGRPDVLATAVILRGIKDEVSKSTAAAAIAGKASQWLLSQRLTNGTWSDDVGITSVAFEAVHPYSGIDSAIASGVEAFLLAQQQPDGSWKGDPYLTAVALRALALTSVTPVDPLLAAAATVRGVVTLAATGEPLAGVTIQATPASGPPKSGVTDANGQYLVQGITPGEIALSVSLPGYQTLTARASVQSGSIAVFSPAMYLVGDTPPAGARIKGTVRAFGTNAPLGGVTVQMTGPTNSTSTTNAFGAFEVAVSSGTYAVSYSLTNYVTQTQQIVLSDGAVADVGTVVMRPVRTTSSLRGTVGDLSGSPLTGAVVSVQGVGSTSTSAAGAYSFQELGGLQFAVTVSAEGFATRNYSLSISQPGDIVQDFKLPSASAPYLSIDQLAPSASSVGLNSDLNATAVVSNPGTVDATGIAGAVITSPDGTRIASLAATDMQGNALSAMSLSPGEQQTVRFKWNTGSYLPGSYRIDARLQVPGTATREDPDGVIVGSVQQSFDITPGAAFIGSVTANPPVLRAGTNTPVKLSGLIQNNGNVTLPAQDYKLAVIDTKTDQTAHTQTISSAEIGVTQLRDLVFADWTPTTGGNFRVELSAPSTPGSLVTTPLYVGDSGSAAFTLDKYFVPAGDQKVRGTIKVSGQSVANGTINDPLVPLVKTAITKAVNYADNYAANHYVNDLRCYACHVQTQAVVGGERSLRYTAPVSALRRAVLMSGTTQGITNDTATSMTSTGPTTDAGPVQYRDWPTGLWITNTTLGLWAASQWHDAAAVNYSKVRMANYLMKAQSSDGTWYPDHFGAWWRGYSPLVGLNVGSLVALRDVLRSQPAPFGKTFVPFVVPGLPSGEKRVAQAPDGTLYIHNFEGALYALSPSGVLTQINTGQAVRSVKVIDGGKLLIASGNGVYVRQPDGSMQRLWAANAYDAQHMADGNYLVTLWGGGALYKVTPAGAVTTLASDSRLAGSTLNTTIMPDGSIVVHSYWGTTALRYSPTGQLLDLPIPVTPAGRPLMSNGYRGGYVLAMENGLFFYNKDWVAERWSNERVFSSTTLADGRLLVSYAGGLYFAEDKPVNVPDVLARIDTSVNKAAGWLKAQSSTDSNNMDLAFRLMGLGHAKKYYQGTARATEFDTLINAYAATLRARQRADGGWVWYQGSYSTSDSMVTAMVGIALDTLNPSPDSPEVRKAVQLLLSRQKADGTWASENGIASVALIPSTWVEIWLPIMLERLGGIDTDVNLTLPANIAFSNPDRATATSVTAPDGTSTHTWKLIGVTENSQELKFDLTLKDMQIDEVRSVAQQANLVFKNSFVEGSVTSPIAVPKVAVGTNLVHTVATDKPLYTEADQAIFTAPIKNEGSFARDAVVRFTVLDANGEVVDVLPLGATVSVPASGTASSTALWPVAGILSGNYVVKAEIMSPAGLIYGAATANFAVASSQAHAATARISADRLSYSAAQTVQLTSRVGNATVNSALDNVQAKTEVKSAAGQSVFTRSEPIAQLAAGGSRQYGYSLPASGLATGSYSASVQLLAADGAVLAQNTTSFSVLGAEQTGIGLTGQLQFNPGSIYIGQTGRLALQVTNTSASSLSQVPLTVRIIDPLSGAVVATFNTTLDTWAAGQTSTLGFDWNAIGSEGQILVAAATAQVAGKEVPVGQANIKILGIPYSGALSADPVEVEAGTSVALNYQVTNPAPVAGHMVGSLTVQTQTAQTLATWPLSLDIGAQTSFAGNQLYTTGEELQTLTAVLSQQQGGVSRVLATTAFTVIDPPVPVDVAVKVKAPARILVLVSCPPGLGTKEDAACVAQRSASIQSYLQALGYSAKTVSTGEAFAAEMRCGSYNTYWISNGAIKLDAQTIGELKAAVRRGEALWMDGVHDSRNQLLHDAAGVKELGKLPIANQIAGLSEGGLYGSQSLPTLGQPTTFEATSGHIQGLFTQGSGQQVPIPAVISNDWGQGKSLLFAFDLGGMITADAAQASSQLAGFVATSAVHTTSGAPTLSVGDLTELQARIVNQSTRTVDFKAEATLPVGLAAVATTPQAQLTANTDGTVQARWNFTLAAGASQPLNWLVRAEQTGNYSVPLSVYSLPKAGSTRAPKLRASTSFALEVKDAPALLLEALTQVHSLQPTASSDKNAHNKAIEAVNQASSLHSQQQYEQAIVQWLAAADWLASIGSVDTSAAKHAIALALEATTDALCIQRCGAAVCQ